MERKKTSKASQKTKQQQKGEGVELNIKVQAYVTKKTETDISRKKVKMG